MRSTFRGSLCFSWLIRSWLAAGVVLLAAVTLYGDSLDATFVAGLRERKLFELAERYCLDRINSSQTSDADRADLAVELVRTLATHAGHVPRPDRATFWQAARAAAADFARRWPNSPRLVQVRIQDVLVPLAQGELTWREHEAGLLPASEIEISRQALAQAGLALAEIEKSLGRDVAIRRRTPPPAGGLAADDLLSLQQQVQYQAARARRLRGLLYPPGSDDRLAQLVDARASLEPLRTQLAADDVLSALVRLELAECTRLAGRYEDAADALAGLDAEGLDPGIRLAARAAALRLASDRKDSVELRRLVEEGDLVAGMASAELDLARLEAWLALGDVGQAGSTANRIDERHDDYWRRRVGQVLAESLSRDTRAQDVGLLSRWADGLVIASKLEESLAVYDRAEGLARQAKQDDMAFELGYKAALVQVRLKWPADAAIRLRSLSMAAPKHPQAAQAHLLAAWYAKGTADEEAILRENLATWPAADSAAEAHLRLAQLAEAGGKWQEALDHYAAVPGKLPSYGVANARLVELANEQPESGPVQEALATSLLQFDDTKHLRAALERWQLVASRSQPNSPRWLRAQYSAALAHFKLGDKQAAAQRLRSVLDQPGSMSDLAWKAKYGALLQQCDM